jgi:hypothetical protein
MENFDGVGAWRTMDAGQVIDPNGVTNDGVPLSGVATLREFALANGDVFAQAVTERLLTYAIGRGLEYDDMPTVRAVARGAAEHGYKFSSLLLGVVESPAFTMNVKSAVGAETTAANQE